MSTPPIILGIDHPVIAVRDMRAAHAAYSRLGFTIAPRGTHLEWGTGNWCIMFADDYLELRGIVDPKKYTHNLEKFLESGEGLMGVAFGTPDAEASREVLVARGLHPPPVRQLTRNFELPEGNVQPRFALSFQEPDETPGLMSVVLCQHLTPQLLRRPDWLEHANGAVAVAGMTGAVADVEQTAAQLERLFGREAIDRKAGRLTIRFSSGQRLLLLSLATARELYPDGEATVEDSNGGRLCAVQLRVRNLVETRTYLESRGVKHRMTSDHALRVLPHEACGVLLEFIA
jgi:hypothetical protein